MSREHGATLERTQRVVATHETVITDRAAEAATYLDGTNVLTQIEVMPGTLDELSSIGVRDLGHADVAATYPNMPSVSEGWGATRAFFKQENYGINIGLGWGEALDLFNGRILRARIIP